MIVQVYVVNLKLHGYCRYLEWWHWQAFIDWLSSWVLFLPLNKLVSYVLKLLPLLKKGAVFLGLSVCLSVCLLWTDFGKIFWRNRGVPRTNWSDNDLDPDYNPDPKSDPKVIKSIRFFGNLDHDQVPDHGNKISRLGLCCLCSFSCHCFCFFVHIGSVVVKDWLLEDKDLGCEDKDKDSRSEDEDRDSNFKCWSTC